MAKLQVELGAEVAELQSKLSDAIKGLKQLQNQSKELDAQFKKGKISADDYYNAIAKNSIDINKASSNVNGLKKSILGSDKALDGMTKSTANAVPAVTEFSRVIQDAPYGMQGVANNLQQLTANFGHLKSSAGGTVPALKLMLSSLAGPAGILLAVSAVTSAIVYFGAKSRKAGNDVASLKEQQDKLKESMDNYVLSLEAVNRANLKGEQSAAKELVNLSLLKAQVNDTTLSLSRRKDAVAELRKLYPDYLKNMTDEKILNGGLATVYDTLTGSIKERARATASMNAIIKNTENILVLESQRAAVSKQLADEEARVNLEMQKINKVASNNPMAGLAKSGVNASSKLLELRKNLNSIKGEIQSLELTNIDLEGNVKTNEGISGIAESIIPKDTQEKVRNKVAKLKTDLGLQVQGIQDVFNLTPINVLGSTLTQLDKDRLNLQAKLLEINAEAQNIIGGVMMQTFSNIGQVIGQGFAQGLDVLSMVGGALLSGIGSLISAMGDKLIEMGTAAVLAGTVTKLFGSVTGIGAGLAAIAGGIALNAVGSGISNFRGAGNTNGTNAGVNTGNNNSFTGGFSGGFTQENKVTFVLRGQDLYGAIDNYLSRNGNLGGKLSFGN